jgi:hypothetical protein
MAFVELRFAAPLGIPEIVQGGQPAGSVLTVGQQLSGTGAAFLDEHDPHRPLAQADRRLQQL